MDEKRRWKMRVHNLNVNLIRSFALTIWLHFLRGAKCVLKFGITLKMSL